MNVADAAEFFGVSKEAIHNRIRRGSLASEMVDGQKHVIIEDETPPTKTKATKKTATTTRKTTASNDTKYYKYLEDQNVKLQGRVEKLEDETRTLRDQKEQMLIEERIKIENIYKEKDEQLKNIINMISSNLMLESKPSIDEEDSVEAEIETYEIEEDEPEENWTSLVKFLKSREYKKKKRKKIIKKIFKKARRGDDAIKLKNDKCYIDLNRFGYKI
jgi:hypothetical protein